MNIIGTQSAKTQLVGSNQYQIQQPLYLNPEDNEFIAQQRKKLILKINLLLLYQQIVQVGIIILCFYIPKFMVKYFPLFYKGEWLVYDDINFYNFDQEAIRVSTILFIVIILEFLLFVRFFKKIKNFKYQGIIYIIYFVFYTLASHSINFGEIKMILLSMTNYIVYVCFIVESLLLLYLCSYNFIFNQKRLMPTDFKFSLLDYIFPYVYLPIMILWIYKMYLIYDGQYEVYKHILSVYINLLTPLWPFLFTIFYIPSILQIYQGKFKLRASDSYLGSVLAISNMFLLCIKD